MKNSIKKLLLVNWMYFQKSLLEFDGNMALVGVNGTGKSTIIDACQMLLLGQKLAKFNSGADAEKRTLESYVRGHVNLENKEFLRDGDVITYLAFEVSVNSRSYIFGLNVEYKEKQARLNDVKYFMIEDQFLTENLFIDNNFPKPFDIFNKELKKNSKYETFYTLTSYQNKIKDVFGLKDSKAYFKILSRTIGLKNITECNKFMNDFVLDENNIDVENLKTSVLEMKKVTSTIELEEQKLNDLEKVTTLGEKISKDRIYEHDLELKIKLSDYLHTEENILNKTNLNESLNVDLNVLNANIKDNNSLKDYKLDYLNTLNNKLISISPDLFNLERSISENNKKLDIEREHNSFLYSKIISLKKHFKVLKTYDKKYNEYYKLFENENFESNSLFKNLKDIKNNTNNNIDSIKEKLNILQNESKIAKDKIVKLENEISILRKNQVPISKNLEDFRKYLKTNLNDKYHKDIEIKFLCECLEITDETYRNAIEGYLGNQRFYLIVDNSYYDDVLKLYEDNKEVSSIRIVNGKKLPTNKAKEGTLGSLVEGSNSTALNYARYILNKVQICSDIYDLENYDTAITKDCICYHNYTVYRINKNNYKYYYIGQLGLQKQLLTKEIELNKLTEEALVLVKEYKNEENKFNNFKILLEEVTYLLENNKYINSVNNINELVKIIKELEKQIKCIKEDKNYLEVQFEINKVKDEISEIKLENSDFENEIINIKASITKNNDEINKNKENLELLKESLEEYNDLEIENCRFMLSEEKISVFFINNLRNQLKNLVRENDKNINKIELLMKEVRNKYSLNIDCVFDNLELFVVEKNKIISDVFKFNSKLIDMKERHYDLFLNQFLNKLYSSINEAKNNIRALNSSLETFKFGSDYYSIKVDITDNLDLKEIYEFSKEYNDDSYTRSLLIDNQLLESKKQRIFDLVSKYIFSDNINSQNYIVDYRNYLNFDVIVHTKEGNKSLNKVLKSQSGGEVQVPFYILSGVAFKQTLDYKRNENTMCVVLYDEAFDKMDSQRIKSMIEFYRDVLQIQIILAAPGKLESLANNIDDIFVVIKDGNKASVKEFSHEN